MEIMKELIEWIFRMALFANALLFIPQATRIYKTKSAEGVSLLTFLGFLLIQLTIVGHGVIHQDSDLVHGYLLSILCCGTVVWLMIYYKKSYSKHPSESTENKFQTLDIMEQLEILENIIALMPGHVYWVDRSGTYLGCNYNQAKSAGLPSRQSIIGKRNSELPWNTQSGVLPQTLDRINTDVMETGKPLIVEEPAILQTGGEQIFLSHKVPLCNNQGSIIGMVGISIDITDRKKAEEALLQEKLKAEAANKAKTEFLENMRHDIRTPLSGIIGLSRFLQKETDQSKIRLFASELASASHELLYFLNEVLESVQVGSGEIPLLKKKFNLNDTMERLITLHQPIAWQKRLSLTLKVDKAVPDCLIGDPVRLYRIILELLVNALKFTKKGQVHIDVGLAKQEGQQAVVKICVEDTGHGIPLEKQQELFLRFKRLTPSYEGIYKGAGLGLSIVKQFLDDLQGEIYIDSQLDRGTKFTCLIPFALPLLKETRCDIPKNHVNVSTQSEQNFKYYNQKNKVHVLVVEDHIPAALLAEFLLTEQGCKVDMVKNGSSAISHAQQNQYDFILMDIGLPDKNGFEVAKTIRRNEARAQHRTFIFGLTAHMGTEKREQALKSGMDRVLTKPLTSELVLELLSAFSLVA